MDAIKQYYDAMSESDQKIALALIPILVGAILLFGVIQPINNWVSNARQDVVDTKQAISLLQSMTPAGSGSGKASYQSLTTLVTNTSRQQGFRLSRFEEKKNGELNVWFDAINFDQMLSWLATLESRYGVTPAYINVSQTNQVGMVRANIRLVAS